MAKNLPEDLWKMLMGLENHFHSGLHRGPASLWIEDKKQ